MLKNSRIASFAAIGVVAALAVGSLVVASNMGFKGRFVFPGSVTTWFSPPYNSPYKTADDLLIVTCPTEGGRIGRTIATSPPGFQFWGGKAGGGGNGRPQNFLLNAGEGYEVRPTTSGEEDVVIVGSHNPFTAVPLAQNGLPGTNTTCDGGSRAGSQCGEGLTVPWLQCPGGTCGGGGSVKSTPDGFVANRDYLISVPWHTVYLTAEDMRTDLPGAARIIRRVETAGSPAAFFFWTGPLAGGNDDPQDYALTLGEAYEVRILTDTPQGVTPSHF